MRALIWILLIIAAIWWWNSFRKRREELKRREAQRQMQGQADRKQDIIDIKSDQDEEA
ncbi:MAG: hypothetical protein ACE5LQ_03925 [Candidatus Bipolaricaulia bacterium]